MIGDQFVQFRENANDKPLIIPIPSLFPYPFILSQSITTKPTTNNDVSSDHVDGRSNDHSNDKPLITPILLFPYSFMFPLITAYLYDQDVILSLLLVNKALKSPLTGYRLKAPIRQKIALELNYKHDCYLHVSPTQMNEVTDLASLSRFASIASIQLNHIYDDVILPGVLSQSITELHLGSNFNQPLTRNMLPAQLKKLTLSNNSKHHLAPGALPDSLEHLDLGRYFNQPLVPGSLPPSLLYLSLGEYFKHPLQPDVLPSKLLTLKLSCYFSHKLGPGILPASLLDLHLGMVFDQRLEPGDLPSSITHLHMGFVFNHELPPGVLPSSLIKIELSRFYNKPLVPDCFPATLHSLVLGDKFSHPIAPGVLPPGLKYLSCNSNTSLDGVLSPGLVTLNQDLRGRAIFSKDIEDLTRSQSSSRLSMSMIAADIEGELLQPGSIPSSTTRLRLNSAVGPGVIPDSVTHLVWNTREALRAGVVPSSVTHLTFGRLFDRLIPPSAIPSSVTHLAFGNQFSQPITPSFIPDSVRYVDLFRCHYIRWQDVILPASVYCVAIRLIRDRCELVTRPPCVVSHSLAIMKRELHDMPDSFVEDYSNIN